MQPNALKPAEQSMSPRPDGPSPDRTPQRLPAVPDAVPLEPHWVSLVDRATD